MRSISNGCHARSTSGRPTPSSRDVHGPDPLLARVRGPESPDTYQAVYEFTPSRRPDTSQRFRRGERSPSTLLAVAANSVPVPEDHRGPIAGLPAGVDYACIKSLFLMLPPWMTTPTWIGTPTARDATWRGFAGKTFQTADPPLFHPPAALP